MAIGDEVPRPLLAVNKESRLALRIRSHPPANDLKTNRIPKGGKIALYYLWALSDKPAKLRV